MSIFTQIYSQLNVDEVTDLVDDISPYVRGRNTDFPAVLIEVPTQSFDRISTGTYRTQSDVELTCLGRSVADAEAVADAVLVAVIDNECNVIDTISRDYTEGYDEDSVGVFSVVINYTIYGA